MSKSISIYQYQINPTDPAENLKKVGEAAKQASKQNSSLLVLPELCLHGYSYENIPDFQNYSMPSIRPVLTEIAVSNQISLAGSFVEKENGNYYNTFLYVSSIGSLIHKYRKMHLFNLLGEGNFFSSGSSISTFESDYGISGAGICYDLRFPEFIRRMAIDDAQLLIIPAEWPKPRIEHWDVLLKARAIENQVFVIGVNSIGNTLGVEYGGHSAIIDPWGKTIAQMDDKEELITVEIDVEEVEKVRSRITVWKDRKPDFYS